jgi:hypothetical protein
MFLTSFSGVTSVLLVILSIPLLTLGMRGLIWRRPFILHSRWQFCLVVISMLPGILLPAWLASTASTQSRGLISLLLWLNPLVFCCLLLMMWFQLKGYLVFGITDQAFRDSLVYSLDKLGIPYEERLSAMHLPSVDADLQVAVQSWMGVGQIKMKKAKDSEILHQIVDVMSEHFRASPTESPIITSLFQTISGGFILVIAVGLLLLGQLSNQCAVFIPQ